MSWRLYNFHTNQLVKANSLYIKIDAADFIHGTDAKIFFYSVVVIQYIASRMIKGIPVFTYLNRETYANSNPSF